MASRLGERRLAVVFAAILIAAIGGLYATVQFLQPAPVTSSEVRSVRLDIDGSDWQTHYESDLTTNNTAFALLREASERLDFSVNVVYYQVPRGVFVLGINGTLNGAGGRYWQYWVNDDYGAVAADHHRLRDGDSVRWRFIESQEGA